MPTKLLINCTDGTQQIVELTQAEIDVLANIASAGAISQAADDVLIAVFLSGETNAAAIPGWASWTEAEAQTWYDTNIGNLLPVANLAAANVVLSAMGTMLWAMARMLLAIRNRVFPRLEGS